jgi:hypothetical protein
MFILIRFLFQHVLLRLYTPDKEILHWTDNKKVKPSSYTPWRSLGERRYSSYSFLTSALDGGEWSASRPGRAITPGERTPGTHCTGGWVGPRAGLDTEATGKILCPCRGSNPDRPVVQPEPDTILTELPRGQITAEYIMSSSQIKSMPSDKETGFFSNWNRPTDFKMCFQHFAFFNGPYVNLLLLFFV